MSTSTVSKLQYNHRYQTPDRREETITEGMYFQGTVGEFSQDCCPPPMNMVISLRHSHSRRPHSYFINIRELNCHSTSQQVISGLSSPLHCYYYYYYTDNILPIPNYTLLDFILLGHYILYSRNIIQSNSRQLHKLVI